MDIKTPPRWRKGQTIFNFLWFLSEKGYHSEPAGMKPDGSFEYAKTRMADPFNIPDDELDQLYAEFLLTHEAQ